MDTETRCYHKDIIDDYEKKTNPRKNINFAELAYKNLLKINDSIQCVNRFEWLKIPVAITSQKIEMLLYRRGAICCFKEYDTLIFAPFTVEGKLIVYGELEYIQPITLDGRNYGTRKRVYNGYGDFEFDEDCAVIIYDYTSFEYGDNLQPREEINEFTTINDETKTYKIMLHSIVLSIKKLIARCDNEEQKKVLKKQAEMLLEPTNIIIPISGINEIANKFDMLQFSPDLQIDELVRAIEFYSKKRRAFNGVPAPDTFEKKERLISSESGNVLTHSNLILYDGLRQRQIAAERINKCFGTDISVRYTPAIAETLEMEEEVNEYENRSVEND